ncbi:MAG: hypothetical protein Q7T16_05780 [Candidatus Burarchaeum sp.]|nr:hypothetical protein [Candidatus Burarchaeum sp.]MDO8340136.1 hypothetical protein [Candidatus Burarchaeum sp.]
MRLARLRHAKMRGAILTLEAMAAMLVLLAAIMLMLAHPSASRSRASQLAMQMQAEDIVEFVAGAGGAEKVGEAKLMAIADALDACIRVSKKGEETFRSACFGEGGSGAKERAAAGYFEIDGTAYSLALLELEKR